MQKLFSNTLLNGLLIGLFSGFFLGYQLAIQETSGDLDKPTAKSLPQVSRLHSNQSVEFLQFENQIVPLIEDISIRLQLLEDMSQGIQPLEDLLIEIQQSIAERDTHHSFPTDGYATNVSEEQQISFDTANQVLGDAIDAGFLDSDVREELSKHALLLTSNQKFELTLKWTAALNTGLLQVSEGSMYPPF